MQTRQYYLNALTWGPDGENSRKYLSFGEKIVKIGLVDPEIICLKLKKEEIEASKIYSSALLASLPSGLNNYISQ